MKFKPYDKADISKFAYLVERIDQANTRTALLNWFTACTRPTIATLDKEMANAQVITVECDGQEIKCFEEILAVHVPKVEVNVGDLHPSDPSKDYAVYGVLLFPEDKKVILIKLNDDATYAPFSMGDQFVLQAGMIKNYPSGPDVITDVGKFFLNELLLVMPFGDIFPYLNGVFSPKKLDNMVAEKILEGKITRPMFNVYMNNGYWFGEDGSISTACWSEKSLTTDPRIPQRKKELLEQYKDHLDDPVVLSKIEKELIQMDKDWLKGDSSEPFYAVGGGKVWNEQRKKMYVMFGLNVAFSKNANDFEFVADSLTDGWTAETLPVAANDIRRGSYGRGIETAKGGDQTKFVLRIFQEVSADEDDCGSHDGVEITLTEKNIKNYLGRWIVDGPCITDENMSGLIGQTVKIRSPLFCKSKPGFCYKCLGEVIRRIGIKRVGMQAIVITAQFVNKSMKSMHQGGMKSTEISDFKRFLR